MDGVNFLNVEYILLKLNILFANIFGPIWGPPPGTTTIGSDGVVQNSSTFLTSDLWFTLGQIGLAGMALAFILLVVSLYIRIKLELYEHEEFHKRDAKYHAHREHGAPVGEMHTEAHKNARWEEVMRLASGTSESDWRRAIMEADIMLGEVLEHAGYRGSSIGDKLKDANPLQMTTLDLAWKAHKVRNDIAHGGEGFHLSQWDTKATVDFYRRVFEEFKFI